MDTSNIFKEGYTFLKRIIDKLCCRIVTGKWEITPGKWTVIFKDKK